MTLSYFYTSLASGTNGAAVASPNVFYTRVLSGGPKGNAGVVLSANVLTFSIAGTYMIRVKAQHFSASGTRFIHKLFKNGSASSLPSVPVQTDNIGNWISISYNIITMAAGDTLDIRAKTNSVTSSLDGKSFTSFAYLETYLEVEIEYVTSYALFYYSKTTNTAGDNESTSYTGRTLTQQPNNIGSLSLSTDTITFPPGNFRVRTLCTHSGGSGRRFVSKFVDASTPAIGNNIGNVISDTLSFLNVPAATTQAIQFKSKVDATTGTPTMGKVGNLGETEIYGLVEILKF